MATGPRQETEIHRSGKRPNRGIGHDRVVFTPHDASCQNWGTRNPSAAPGAYSHENRTWLLNTSLVTAR